VNRKFRGNVGILDSNTTILLVDERGNYKHLHNGPVIETQDIADQTQLTESIIHPGWSNMENKINSTINTHCDFTNVSALVSSQQKQPFRKITSSIYSAVTAG